MNIEMEFLTKHNAVRAMVASGLATEEQMRRILRMLDPRLPDDAIESLVRPLNVGRLEVST